MRKLWKTSLLFAAVGLVSMLARDVAAAHIVYFSETGPDKFVLSDPEDPESEVIVDGGLTENTTPTINLNVGESKQLHVWINMDNRISSATQRVISSVALDIEASAPGLSTNSFTMANPENLGFGGTRWDATVVDGINESATKLVTNAYGFSVASASIGNSLTNFDSDQLHDGATNGFYLGTFDFTATAAGSYGLYFRTGLFKSIVVNQSTHPFQYGNADGPTHQGNVVGSGDAIDAGLILADAIINVTGGGRTNVFEFGGDPTGATSVPFGGVQPLDIPVGAPAGKLAIDDAWLRNGFFEVYFDLSFSEPGTDVDDVIALLQGQGINALPGRPLDNGVAYDMHIRVPGTPGNDLVMDFDFTAGGLAGVSVESVGVPEPSTFVLAALGCVGLLAFRRRKA